ncbi:YihY/virulence factor BrkB family protein [Eubacterium sp.]|uniref:YihY/virulence factor BrkB family protein n=1 Tax=Eubacterium sp. TaxID=142586 RepID=UPI00351FA560
MRLKPLNHYWYKLLKNFIPTFSGTAISITAIIAIWSASKGVLSVMFGLYEISKIHQNRNYFISRFISMIYTVFFVVAIILTMVLLVFGNKIFTLLISLFPVLKNITLLTLMLRYSLSFIILTIFFMTIYKFANIRLTTFAKSIPGAMFSALGWLVFSYVFSLYIDNFAKHDLYVWQFNSLHYSYVMGLFLYLYFLYRCRN